MFGVKLFLMIKKKCNLSVGAWSAAGAGQARSLLQILKSFFQLLLRIPVYYEGPGIQTTRPPRQLALSDKSPSRTNCPPTHPLFSTKRRRGRFVRAEDKSPSLVLKTNRPPFSY